GALLRLLFKPDQPEGREETGRRDTLRPTLKVAVLRRVTSLCGLFLTYDKFRLKAMLALGAAQRPGKDTGLQGRNPQISIKLGAPGLLVCLYLQQQLRVA